MSVQGPVSGRQQALMGWLIVFTRCRGEAIPGPGGPDSGCPCRGLTCTRTSAGRSSKGKKPPQPKVRHHVSC